MVGGCLGSRFVPRRQRDGLGFREVDESSRRDRGGLEEVRRGGRSDMDRGLEVAVDGPSELRESGVVVLQVGRFALAGE